jgi:hypothetical protein
MLDPLEYANQLEKHGLSRPLAELIARGSLSRPPDVATKEDIARLEGRLSVLFWVVGGVGFSIFLAILALQFSTEP